VTDWGRGLYRRHVRRGLAGVHVQSTIHVPNASRASDAAQVNRRLIDYPKMPQWSMVAKLLLTPMLTPTAVNVGVLPDTLGRTLWAVKMGHFQGARVPP